tara:strand:+ start:1146 stop:1646 length:501 start_codon:yes stop_codon:yes gene_type:complete
MNVSAGTAGDYLGISGLSRLSTGLSQNSALSNYYASTNSLLGTDYSVGSDSASAALFFGTFAAGGVGSSDVNSSRLGALSLRNYSFIGQKIAQSKSGNLIFGIGVRYKPTNFIFRFARGARSALYNTNKTPGAVFSTHFNIQKVGVYNYHLYLNPNKWKYYYKWAR